MAYNDPEIAPLSDIEPDNITTLHTSHAQSGKPALGTFCVGTSFIEQDLDSLPVEPTPPSSSTGSGSSPAQGLHRMRAAMPFSSSPVLYPASSSPPKDQPKKRKLFQTLDTSRTQKRPKVSGPFVEDDENDADGLPPPTNGLDSVEEAEIEAQNGRLALDDAFDIDDIIPDDQESKEASSLPPLPSQPMLRRRLETGLELRTSTGQTFKVPNRSVAARKTYEETVAKRSVGATGRAKKAYYGIEIQKLIHDAKLQAELDQAQRDFEKQEEERTADRSEAPNASHPLTKGSQHQLWTEKYRAKRFTDLVGDERTHRQVLRWLKAWDDIVFPGSVKSRSRRVYEDRNTEGERQHRKILLLTGPPGLGKTTLAHVCAKKAGYEGLEINASDDRSRDIVRGRIKDALGTETVRGIREHGKERRAGKPVCVIVDEVDGVVTGSGGSGEGGFMKALIDLVHLDQHNANNSSNSTADKSRKRKGDKFRMLRPMILVCNDVYAPSMRPLRTSGLAEIVYVRKPPMDKVIQRLRNVFETEQIACDNDAIRRICEGAWGMGTRKQNSLGGQGAGEGDLRGILVHAEWMAHKFLAGERGGSIPRPKLTRKWVEGQVGQAQNAAGQKGLGRGGTREVIDRLFVEGAGLPNLPTALSAEDARLVEEAKSTAIGVADIRKRAAITALREMVTTCGEYDRLMTECFTTYPTQIFQDDTQLSKPNAAYDWLHFHDSLSRRLYGGQEWELAPYMNTGACAFHHLFATVDKGHKTWNEEKKEEEDTAAHPFSGPRADFAAHEAEKENKTVLTELQASFSAPLLRLFSSVDNMATELVPNVNRMLAPDVKPVVIGGSSGIGSIASVRKETEKRCVQTAVRVMHGLEVKFDQVKIEVDPAAGPGGRAAFAYRMEPPLDTLAAFSLDKSSKPAASAPTRYAVRQVLEQELRKERLLQSSKARQNRSTTLGTEAAERDQGNKENHDPQSKPTGKASEIKRDFFGRVIKEERPSSAGKQSGRQASEKLKEADRVWVSFHEGFSNAVRKPITLRELMDGF